ncbi:MFS transporter [Berryella wangjianweii]|nr:MFS transporter [Berryella wangjianweii]
MNASVAKESMSLRHMLIVVTGVMITFGCSALCFSTWGSFQPVVATSLGIEKTAFALYVTIMYLAMTVASPFAGKLLQTVDARILLSICACLVGGAFFLMSVAPSIEWFYVAGALLGAGEVVLLWLAVPTLINNWFVERGGFFIGICMCMTGVGGAVWNAVFTALVANGMDFHEIYRIWAIIALVTSLPFTLFAVRTRPQDIGLLPYGASAGQGAAAAKPRGLSVKAAMKSPVFYAICLFAGLINIAILIAMQFPSYARSLTDVAFDVVVVGGVMATVMMVGQAIAKVALGGLADRNARGTLLFAFSCGIIGILLCWFGFASEYLLYSGAFIFGFMYATAVTLVPIMVRQIFGTREYSLIYSRISSVFNLVASFAALIWAGIQQSAFGFNGVFVAGIAMLVVVLLIGLYCFSQQRSIVSRWTEE